MRIAVLHPRMSALGGAERVAMHSIQAGLRGGHEVYFVSEEFDVEHVEDFFSCKGLFDRVQKLAYSPFRPRLANSLLLYRQLLYHGRKIKEILSDHPGIELIISTQDAGYVPSTEATLIQYCYYPEYFSHVQQASSSALWNMYYWPAKLYYRRRVSQIDYFLSTSDYTRSFVKSVWRRDSTTIYPPCPVNLYRHNNGTRQNLFVTIGRIVPQKRMELFLEIAASIPSAEFAIIGSVEQGKLDYYKLLVASAPRNVRIVNSSLWNARELLFAAKAYLHCAQDEQFGISIVEAMASGCVPVVHDSGGPREIVTDEVGFRWRTPEEASTKLSTLIGDETLRQRLSKSAIDRSTIFSSERFESKLLAFIEDYSPDRSEAT